jgi:hypothetical protein
VLNQLPTGGWKVLNAGDFAQAQIGDSVVLAAEHPDVAGAWLTLSMSRRQADTWVCHATNAPVIPVPSKKVRRNGLELSFLPQEPVLAGSHDASLELTITNTSDRPWVNVAGDDDITVAWLRDNRGTRLSGSGYKSFHAPLVYLPRLPPGRSATISNINLLTPSLADLPPGDYQLEARLNSLGLTAQAGVLPIV